MRYFLGQDFYGNWYSLPETERETWNRLISREDAYNYDAWNVILSYKININSLTFENPVYE